VSTFVLRVEPFQGEPFTHAVSGDALVFGRSSKADLVVPDRYMSRLQARLFREGGVWLIENLGGRNPTLLNGKAITQPTPIASGDLIAVSDTRLYVQAPGAAPAAREESTDAGHTLFRAASALLAESEARALRDDVGEAGLRQHTARLRRLNEFHRALAAPITLQALLELVLDRAFADLGPEEAVIFLREGDGEFSRVAQRRLPGMGGDFLYSRSLAREVTEKGLAALVEDTSADDRFSAAHSIQSSGVRSLVAAPLLEPDGCPGFIVLNSRAHVRKFSEDDMEELVFLASAAAMRIRNIALMEDAAKRKVLEKELALARQIQMALLPDTLPDVPGYEIVASNIPTRAVSGDLYQVQMRRDGRECLVLLADVAGKGMAAALLTASLEALAAGPIEVGLAPDDICTKLSRRLYARTSAERYATGFVAVVHTDTGRFCWTNAGHNPALVLRASGAHEELKATGLPLGLLPIGEYERGELVLAPGDLVILYTDGVTEAANPAGDEYGVERLLDLARAHAGKDVNALAAALQAGLDAFADGVPFGDDRTFVLLRRTPLG
jgi:sigma-B regulation protein RsbU (phosphoserine phosphatase)